MLQLGDVQQVTTPDGRQWELSRLELRHIRAFRDWIKSRVGDPYATVDRFLGKIGDEQLIDMLREAEKVAFQLRNFSMACPLALEHLQTEEGLAFVVGLLLRDRHATHTEADAWQVAQAIERRLAEVLEKAQGALPNGGSPAEPATASPGESTGCGSTPG